MKKIYAILALMAAASAVNAADVTFATSDKGGGVAEVTWAGTAVVGMALDVTVNSGTLTGVTMDGFNVYIDEAWKLVQPGEAGLPAALPIGSNPKAQPLTAGPSDSLSSFALCAGYLDATPGLATGKITFTASETTTLTLSENAKRGGIVDTAGKSTAVGLPLAVTATAAPVGPTCADYNLTRKDGATDVVVNISDVTKLVSYITTYGGSRRSVANNAAGYRADFNLTGIQGGTDTVINISDVTALVSYITTNGGSRRSVTCTY